MSRGYIHLETDRSGRAYGVFSRSAFDRGANTAAPLERPPVSCQQVADAICTTCVSVRTRPYILQRLLRRPDIVLCILVYPFVLTSDYIIMFISNKVVRRPAD